MGGATSTIESDNLVQAIEELRKRLDEVEYTAGGMYLDSISIFVKNKNGKYQGIGNNGIETDVGMMNNFKPTKKVVIFFHIHS